MPRHLLFGGGIIDELTNYQYLNKEKVTENTVVTSLAAWLPFDQLSCKFENIGERDAPTPPNRHNPGMDHTTSVMLKLNVCKMRKGDIHGLFPNKERYNFIPCECHLQFRKRQPISKLTNTWQGIVLEMFLF